VVTTFAIIYFLLSAFDSWLTAQRINRYGINVEFNSGIRFLSKKIGPELGAIVGVMAPATALIALAVLAHLQWVLPLLVGFRLRAFFNQCESLKFECDIKKFAAEINAASSSESERRPPSTVAPPKER
jgi:hypothetical protein